jgi:hypothetical protein
VLGGRSYFFLIWIILSSMFLSQERIIGFFIAYRIVNGGKIVGNLFAYLAFPEP